MLIMTAAPLALSWAPGATEGLYGSIWPSDTLVMSWQASEADLERKARHLKVAASLHAWAPQAALLAQVLPLGLQVLDAAWDDAQEQEASWQPAALQGHFGGSPI